MQHSLAHRRKIELPNETVAECTQVAIGILVKPLSVECPVESGLHVSEHRINSAKFSHLIRMPSIHNHGLMKATHSGHSTEARLFVADHLTTTGLGRLTPIGNGGKGEGPHRPVSHAAGAPRHLKRQLRRLEPCFQNHDQAVTIAFSAEVRIIDLIHSTQRIVMLALADGLHVLTVNQPCHSVVRTKLTHECQRGNPSFGLLDQLWC